MAGDPVSKLNLVKVMQRECKNYKCACDINTIKFVGIWIPILMGLLSDYITGTKIIAVVFS